MNDAQDPLSSSDEGGDEMPTAPFWMTTFGDMMTILLAFFVLIVSMSEVEVKKFKKALSHFRGHPSLLTKNSSVVPTEDPPPPTEPSTKRQRAEQYKEFLEELEAEGLADKVQANLTERGIHLVIADSVMFRTGEARLIEPSRTVLRILAKLLDTEVKSVVVEGHTDNRPIDTERYPSNWELSTVRAASSVRFLHEHASGFDPSRFTAVGYGSHRPRATNETPPGRARNRRVEIMLTWHQWNSNETPPPSRLPSP